MIVAPERLPCFIARRCAMHQRQSVHQQDCQNDREKFPPLQSILPRASIYQSEGVDASAAAWRGAASLTRMYRHAVTGLIHPAVA